MNTTDNLYKSIGLLALVTGVLLMIPLVAMQFTQEVMWTLGDFIFAAVMIFGTGLTYLTVTRKAGQTVYRLAVAVALAAGFLLIWLNGAVGIIGSEDNLINAWYYAVALAGIAGALLSRFYAKGMALTMLVMALGQALIAVVALGRGYYLEPHSSVTEVILVNGFFITLFTVSALLFRQVGEKQSEKSTEE